ncbi:hypothetical protein OAG84_04575 [Akkermansiaceae bacterium]|nr:hypothetical protein [Akkermansiaceae bacterium]
MILLSLSILNIILLGAYLHLRFGPKRLGIYLPDFFLAGIALYVVGAIYLSISGNRASDLIVVQISLVVLASGTSGCVLSSWRLWGKYSRGNYLRDLANEDSSFLERLGVIIGFAFSLAICVIFVVLIISSTSLSALLADIIIFDDKSNALSLLRKEITNGSSGYLAPGFVMQFRDFLGPVFFLTLLFYSRSGRGKKMHKITLITASIVCFSALLISGNRGGLVLLSVAFFYSYAESKKIHRNHKHKIRRVSKNVKILIVSILFISYWSTSFLLGRLESGSTWFGSILDIFVNVIDRVILRVPYENMATFYYWSELSPSYGQTWWEELGRVSVGNSRFGLSNILHRLNGGSIEGNSPLGLPVDVWVAWGWLGAIFIPALYGIFLSGFDLILSRHRSAVLHSVKIVLALAVLRIYSPYGFMLYGGASSLILAGMVIFLRASICDVSGRGR